jgi:hypothetical protein
MSDYRIDAIGFSTFVMNLIGVDKTMASRWMRQLRAVTHVIARML